MFLDSPEMIYKHRVLPPPDENGQDYPVEFEILDTAGQVRPFHTRLGGYKYTRLQISD